MYNFHSSKSSIFFVKKVVKNFAEYKICSIFALAISNGALVQLVRIRACHARGQGFESPTHRQRRLEKVVFFLCVGDSSVGGGSGDLSTLGCCLPTQIIGFAKRLCPKACLRSSFRKPDNLRLQQPRFGHLSTAATVRALSSYIAISIIIRTAKKTT